MAVDMTASVRGARDRLDDAKRSAEHAERADAVILAVDLLKVGTTPPLGADGQHPGRAAPGQTGRACQGTRGATRFNRLLLRGPAA